jgi:hypothetical protein
MNQLSQSNNRDILIKKTNWNNHFGLKIGEESMDSL